MDKVSIAATTHAVDHWGKTVCGEEFPRYYRSTRWQVTCPDCLNILEKEQADYTAAQRAKAQQEAEEYAAARARGESGDIPWDAAEEAPHA